MNIHFLKILAATAMMACAFSVSAQTGTYPIVGTAVQTFYGNSGIITQPASSDAFYGQDAQYPKNTPSYTDNGDGTVTDNVTGLMWQQHMGTQITYTQVLTKADTLSLAGYTDWRLPNIKELYSLILFTGKEGMADDSSGYIKYIDTDYFVQPFGDVAGGARLIDAQTWSFNQYTGLTMGGDTTIFGVNFIDGRIKGYPKYIPMTTNPKVAYFRMVRGNTLYSVNNLVDNGDGTVSDLATGLMWQQSDDSTSRDWQTALSYAEGLVFAGHDDWRLPDAKELQSLVDYSRCPQATASPAIDPVFHCTGILDPNGVGGQYPYYWSSTTHLTGPTAGTNAAYVAFGKAQGKMNNTLMDVHGAGSQRSDPKSGLASNYPAYMGPQGDVQYVYNYVRCVRNIEPAGTDNGLQKDQNLLRVYPNPAVDVLNVTLIGNTAEPISMELYSYTGQKIKSVSIPTQTNNIKIDISELNPGLYLLQANINGMPYSTSFIK